MSIHILKTEAENRAARQVLRQRGVSCLASPTAIRFKRLLHLPMDQPTDENKSWDILKTLNLIANHLQPTDAILDLGAYCSEILPTLHRQGYTTLHGIDLNPRVVHGLFAGRINYRVGDFYQTEFDDTAFRAVTAISAIEHGLDLPRLLKEVSRILSPGGLFVGSTDYWPDKIDCSGTQPFGMSWMIFSRKELEHLVELAAQNGLELLGHADYHAQERMIRYCGQSYTFAWFAFRKREP